MELIRAYRQRSAVEVIWRLGGSMQREYDRPGADSVVPRWYRTLFGDDFMNPVVLVRLAGTAAEDNDLGWVGRLTQLRMLDLRDTRISDEGLRQLRRLRDVQILVLTGTTVSEKGLTQLVGMRELQVLCLEETKITDAGLGGCRNFLVWLGSI